MIQAAFTPSAGQAQPLGAQARDGGVNFAVFAEHASALLLCLFDSQGQEHTRWRLHGPHADGLWTGFVPGLAPGQVYGLRADGPWAPALGLRHNVHKLLLDPAAVEIVGHFEWRPEHHGYVLGQDPDLSFDTRDNAAGALKARVPALHAPAPAATRPRVPAAERVLYEVHVKGYSQLHPQIPPALRGTYAALAHPAAIAHFQALGVTTLSLLPVHYALNEPLLPPGLVNYWGYNTLGFFCPSPRLSCTPHDPAAVNAEFRQMVATLHEHGLEVLLDVVYNHTPEGNHHGPTLSFRGLGERSWYRLDDAGHPLNWSACGNTLNLAHPQVAHFVRASLRHWVQQMGVDGFRFDLAPVLGRNEAGAFDPQAAFFTALAQDPVLADVVLVAEPWDAGPQGYRVGQFPPPWQEWNDRFRDAARGFWLGRGGISRAEFAARFAGSADLYAADAAGARPPTASVNFLSVHDGYTLADLVSHRQKHNHANGEDNRDGRDDELCHNFGTEGPSDDPAVVQTRLRVRRALMATLLLAAGTPLLCAGDEFGNSQQGNNNAWCQDNTTGWLGWPQADAAFAAYVAQLTALRRSHGALRPARWPQPAPHWQHLDDEQQPLLCMPDPQAAQPLLLAFNPGAHTLPLALPPGRWQTLLCSEPGAPAAAHAALPPHGLRLLQRAA
jgi:glycogen operon protein